MEKDTVLIDDPFRVVTALWEEAPGLKDDSDPRAWANWRQRVARFLYWAVDGGLHPGEMTLDMLIKCERRQSCSLRARDILQVREIQHPAILSSSTCGIHHHLLH